MVRASGRHRGGEEISRGSRQRVVAGGSLIQHAAVEALLRASFEVHGALSLLGEGAIAAEPLRDALDCLNQAVNQIRREVIDHVDGDVDDADS